MAAMTLSIGCLLLVLFCFLAIGEQASVLQRRELSNDAGVRASFEWVEQEYPAEYRHGKSPRVKHAKRAKTNATAEECRDMNTNCRSWAMTGECKANPDYMLNKCGPSCGVCTRVACEDKDDDCIERAAQGECDSNPARMRSHCKLSCHVCTQDSTEIFLNGGRPGAPTKTHSCNRIRGVPEELRDPAKMLPGGLNRFYEKYTEAYGIPIIASANVSDDALKRVCYVVRVLLAEHSGVRRSFYKRSGRLAIIGLQQQTTTIPEHSHLNSTYYNWRSRGLGASLSAPISTAGEENILCFSNDSRFPNQDIFLHEFAHAAHILGGNYGMPTWGKRLYQHYTDIIASGLWGTSYATTTVAEFFAVGTQAYYNSYLTLPTPQCMSGDGGVIVTRKRLRDFDPVLYGLIREIFPCDNMYINRCNKSRAAEMRQEVRMDCENSHVPDTYVGDQSEPAYTPDYVESKCSNECFDGHESCPVWSSIGECAANPGYMLSNCRLSCLVCTP